jgi:hypothetical protein
MFGTNQEIHVIAEFRAKPGQEKALRDLCPADPGRARKPRLHTA